MITSDQLLIEITNCKNFKNCIGTPCEKIVSLQSGDRQLPEPWNGDIENCKILFISSNPSINDDEFYPTQSWNIDERIDFFKNRFSIDKKYVRNYLHPKMKNKENENPRNWVRYWAGVRSYARQLMDKIDVIPGKDYALMEIVRCKSRKEEGVTEAQSECISKYLEKSLLISRAKITVVVGAKAKIAFQDTFNDRLQVKENSVLNTLHLTFAERKEVLFIPHPNSRRKRRLDENEEIKEDLECLQKILTSV